MDWLSCHWVYMPCKGSWICVGQLELSDLSPGTLVSQTHSSWSPSASLSAALHSLTNTVCGNTGFCRLLSSCSMHFFSSRTSASRWPHCHSKIALHWPLRDWLAYVMDILSVIYGFLACRRLSLHHSLPRCVDGAWYWKRVCQRRRCRVVGIISEESF